MVNVIGIHSNSNVNNNNNNLNNNVNNIITMNKQNIINTSNVTLPPRTSAQINGVKFNYHGQL